MTVNTFLDFVEYIGVLIPTDITASPSVHGTLPDRWHFFPFHICLWFRPIHPSYFFSPLFRGIFRKKTSTRHCQTGTTNEPRARGCRWVLFFIDFQWLRSWWQGVSTHQGRLSISWGGAARRCVKGSSVQGEKKGWNVACCKGKTQPRTLTPVINSWNAVNFSSGWRRVVAKSTFYSHKGTVSGPWALKESKYPEEGVSLVQHAELQCKIQPIAHSTVKQSSLESGSLLLILTLW